MELKQIEYFLQLARFEHMSQTADFLGIYQSTLSKSLNSLERELGIKLFDRVGNRIRLNENGVRFREYVERGMQLINNGIISAKQTQYEVTGSISIACLTYAPILLPCINEYSALNPYINFSVMQTKYAQSWQEERNSYDFVLISSGMDSAPPQNEQFWVSQPLFTDDGYLVVAPKHPLYDKLPESGSSIDLESVRDENFIGMQRNDVIVSSSGQSPSHTIGFIPRTYFQTDNFIVRMRALEAGTGVALIPGSCLADAKLLCPGLKYLKTERQNSYRTISLMRKKKSMLSEAALDFWDFAMEHFGLPEDNRP